MSSPINLTMEDLLVKLINLVSQMMPELEVVDEDYGQIEMLEQENQDTYPLTFPAVLINAADVAWSNAGNLSQKGLVTVRVRLALDCYDDTQARSGTTELIKARMKKVHKLHKLLQGLSIEGCSELIRTTSHYYTASHGIKVYENTYTCTVSENVNDVLETTMVRPRITAQR